jgi:small neutral amino acid transporter SnatA (MarC family)
LSERVLVAFEQLMGLLSMAVALEMLLSGIEGFVRHCKADPLWRPAAAS